MADQQVRLVPVVALFILFAMAAACFGQDRITSDHAVRTDSPRHTFESFRALTSELESALIEYRNNRTKKVRARIARIGDEFLSLLNLSSIPEAVRRKRGVETGTYLLDIFGRIDLPTNEDVPTAESFDANPTKPAKWRVPNTPIEIERVMQGPREGEYLFSEHTLRVARHFYTEIAQLPLKSSLGISSWSRTVEQLTGPAIPPGLVAAIPDILKRPWLNTPVWKILGVVVLCVLAIFLVIAWVRLVMLGKPDDSLRHMLRRLLIPPVIMVIAAMLGEFTAYELNIAGTFAEFFASLIILVKFLAAAWLFWLVAAFTTELIIQTPKIPDQGLDASLLRLCARIIGISGAIVILAYAGNVLGLPVFSLVAGLGIGGLAVALAIRPTLENLVGGLILYADRPVRVGDYCSFNNLVGTIESIGVRSTQLRALDRTLISIPNAKLADMEIINWAHCDQMLINTMIGLRYETQPDQLRHVLAKLREMFCAHPKIDSETVRVRFVGYGASSLDINIRVYALTREWNDFYAIREDVLLRASDIVSASGTGFAFPSQTLYMRRDEGIDAGLSKKAVEQVDGWRKSGKLPFPHMPQAMMDEIADTLDYPPLGSLDSFTTEATENESVERLSAGTQDDEEEQSDLEESTQQKEK